MSHKDELSSLSPQHVKQTHGERSAVTPKDTAKRVAGDE